MRGADGDLPARLELFEDQGYMGPTNFYIVDNPYELKEDIETFMRTEFNSETS